MNTDRNTAGSAGAPRTGLSQLECIMALGIVGLMGLIAVPIIQKGRETARRMSCQHNLRRLTQAMHNYQDVHGNLPPAAVWSTDATTSLALHSSKRVERITHENWVQLLLPFAGEEYLSQQFSAGMPIGDPSQSAARTTQLALMTCPADSFNRRDNPHTISPPGINTTPIDFARGNYGINGGTHDLHFDAPSTASPHGDYGHLLIQSEPRRYELWGNGIAGINHVFSIDEFRNGRSTLVAIDEVRAGIHPLDPRGVWALGQIGGSVTWAHGVGSDDFGPNNQWPRADDVLGCNAVHRAVGSATLLNEHMPCVDYVDVNQQATARSLHTGGVNVGFLDGSVRFISNRIDPGLWHVIHSRETPSARLADKFAERLAVENFTEEAIDAALPGPPESKDADGQAGPWNNSVGMTFVRVPAGEFTMGLPDRGNDADPPAACPAHQVRITRTFLLSIHEVTRGQFERVMEYVPSEDSTASEPDTNPVDQGSSVLDGFPVANVTWDEAAEFCRRLTELSEEAGRRYRLPTEAEWEYACRAGSISQYAWSGNRSAGDHSGDTAGIVPPLPLAPVGSYPANQFGLYDMRRNVWEWTADWFDRDYYLRSPRDDPRGPESGYIKVVRGGDWRFVGEPCRIDYPMMPPWKSNPFVGFRVACDVTGRAATRSGVAH